MWRTVVVAAFLMAAGVAGAQAPPRPSVDADAAIAANSYAIGYADGRLTGPGAAKLREAVAGAQFVLLGEDHYDHEIPRFATALYAVLHAEHGFHHMAVEQERLAMVAASGPPLRGDPSALGRLAGRYPTLFEFASDEDLRLLADVGRLERNTDPLWGVEQTTSGLYSLERLRPLAPNPRVRAQVDALISEARRLEPEPIYRPTFYFDAATLAKLNRLQADFQARPGSEAERLLSGLVRSAQVYDYYRRAEAGEPVGLYNNTEREAWMKGQFMAHYRAAQARGEARPKAMLKFGDWHMYRGMGPTGAYTIGNFVHELATANGAHAIGVQMVALRADMPWKDVAPEIRALLPATPPTEPTLYDLRPLRPVGRAFRQRAPADAQWITRNLLMSYDFILVLPHSRRASTTLSGLRTPFPAEP